MKFQCPHCSQNLSVTKELEGKTLDCPTCGESIQIPPVVSLANPNPMSSKIAYDNNDPEESEPNRERWNSLIFHLKKIGKFLAIGYICWVVFVVIIRDNIPGIAGSPYGEISRVLKAEEKVTKDSPTVENYAQIQNVSSVIDQIEEIDLSRCPEDFREAYRAVILESQASLTYLESSPNTRAASDLKQHFQGRFNTLGPGRFGGAGLASYFANETNNQYTRLANSQKRLWEVLKKYDVKRLEKGPFRGQWPGFHLW